MKGRRTAAFLLTTTCAVGLLAATPVAAQLRGSTSAPATQACGGLRPDAAFAREVAGLGRTHACTHLRGRATTGVSHPAELAAQGRQARAALASTDPADVGRWSAAVNPGTKTVGITAVLLHTGKVLLFGGKYKTTDKNTAAYLFDPETGTGHEVPAPAAVFCGGITILSDGRMFSSGGADPVPKGIVDQYLFDPISEQWQRQPDTGLGRYYPTATKLADGRVLVTAGNELDGTTTHPYAELFTPPAPNATSGTVERVGGDHVTKYYPRQWLMPDGNVLQMDNRKVYRMDTTGWDWTPLKPMLVSSGAGAAGLALPAGPNGSSKVMMIGGLSKGTANNRTQRFNYANPAAGWSYGSPMPTTRSHMNVVQVPDGSAFGIGGNSTNLYFDGQTQTMSYDPGTDTWTNLAVQSVRRGYHSTAVLLPDGRIMSAGDGGAGGGRQLIDFYSPPYLFQGPRPQITSTPAQLDYASSFTIGASGPAASRAVLMAPAATTHANEMHARHVELAVTPTTGGFQATAPPSGKVAPPGHYMLFVLTPDGIPSVAEWVHVGP